MNTSCAPFFLGALIVLVGLTVLCLIRAILGPKLADRIMAVNMIGTMTIAMIAILSVLLGEAAILDVALIYAVISFVSVIVLTKIYIGIYREKKNAMGRAGKKAAPADREEDRP